jgi:hypothetical protein
MDRLDAMRRARKQSADKIRYFRRTLCDDELQMLYIHAVSRPPKPTKIFFKGKIKYWQRVARQAGNAKGFVEIPRRELSKNAKALRRLSIGE